MPTVFSGNRTIQAGVNRTPSFNMPGKFSFCDLVMSRTNWPAAGVTIRIFFTYDNQATWVVVREETIAAGSVNPRTGTIDPAAIGFGWERDPQPQRVLVETDSPSQFVSFVTVDVIGELVTVGLLRGELVTVGRLEAALATIATADATPTAAP